MINIPNDVGDFIDEFVEQADDELDYARQNLEQLTFQ